MSCSYRPERAPFIELAHIFRNGIGFTFKIIFDRAGEFWMRQPVRRANGYRQEPSRQFVFALRAAFEHLQAMGNRVFDALLVAGFEVQAGHVFQCAPMPSV